MIANHTRALVALTLAVLTVLVLSIPVFSDKGQAPVVAGVLDLSGWDFDAKGSVRLDGQWDFYWERLLMSDDLDGNGPAPSGVLNLPGTWKGYRLAEKELPGTGYATLRLRVLLPPDHDQLALYIPNLLTAYKLWVNNQLVASAGEVGTSQDSSSPQYRPAIVSLDARAHTLDLVLHLSNFEHREAGPQRSLELGSELLLRQQKSRTAVAQAALLGGMGFLGLHYLLLSGIGRGTSVYLYLGLFFLLVSVRSFVAYDLALDSLPAGVGWEWHIKADFLSSAALTVVAIRTITAMFPAEAVPRFVSAGSAFGAVALVVPLLTSASVTSRLMTAYHILNLTTVAYAVIVGTRAVLNRRANAWPYLIVATAGWMGVSIEILRFQRISYVNGPLPVLIWFVLVLFQALLHTRDHGRLAQQRTALLETNHELNATLQEQLRELRAARSLLATQEEAHNRKIAEFLHSRVQTRLLVIWHQLKQLEAWLHPDKPQAVQVLTKARAQLEEVREKDIRLASHLLHPTAISVGLVPALRTLSTEYSDHFRTVIGVSPEIEALDDVRENRIPESVRLTAYRVAAEGLGNVVVHAGATEVRIDLSLTSAGELRLSLQDNGRGFEPGTTAHGLGLRTIAARISESGGHWTLQSRPGEGARLEAVIPLASTNPGPTT